MSDHPTQPAPAASPSGGPPAPPPNAPVASGVQAPPPAQTASPVLPRQPSVPAVPVSPRFTCTRAANGWVAFPVNEDGSQTGPIYVATEPQQLGQIVQRWAEARSTS